MEARKITVVNNRTQSKKVFMSGAETLAELKADARAAGIDYEGMTWYEGLSKTELISDSSLLPHDIRRGDVVTNELAFLLTTTNKKIKSGAMSRADAYAYIKGHNLSEVVKSMYGKNYTNLSTVDLINFVEHNHNNQVSSHSEAHNDDCPVKNTLKYLISVLYENDVITGTDMNKMFGLLNGNNISEPSLESSYSDKELDDMFGNIYE